MDLRSNIAAEARAKIVYEGLINFTQDAGTIEALKFLMTREITHMKAFTAALESLGEDRFTIGQIPPDREWVNIYMDDSTGEGGEGETNSRGPWNEGDDGKIVEAPAFKEAEAFAGDGEAPGGTSARGKSAKSVHKTSY